MKITHSIPTDLTFRDTFIYEYVGDVVNPTSFKKRMRDYALEGIQHFYFMMLQKDEVRSNVLLGLSVAQYPTVYRRNEGRRDRALRQS